jgi:hypothetical protein
MYSTQVVLRHATPEVLQANTIALVAIVGGGSVEVSGPTWMRESAVVEFRSDVNVQPDIERFLNGGMVQWSVAVFDMLEDTDG